MHKKNKGIKNPGRREFLSGFGMLPLIPASSFPSLGEIARDESQYESKGSLKTSGDRIRLGLIGFGFRGEQLARALGYATKDWLEKQKSEAEKNPGSKLLENFYEQNDLNIEIAAVSDVFSIRLKKGMETFGENCRGYADFRDLLRDESVDAVIIATPDHWHADMAIEASRNGKHVYLEKCMTRTAEEAVRLHNILRESNIVFQLGHQGRQSDMNKKAMDIVGKGTLGKISLIETTTNRNNAFGAWQWPIDERGNNTTIDWEMFEGPAPNKVPFSPERYFRWRCWFDYGTGMAGDLLTHEYDALNTILDLGIPGSAVASGGIYIYDDGREVPDVFQANFEYETEKLSLLYSGTLANGTPRGTLIMGSDATLELGNALKVWVDGESAKYRNRIAGGIIDPSKPVVNYSIENLEIDGLTSATSKYFADRGLMYTYQEGKLYDTTSLHLSEWLDCIRKGGTPSCSIEQGFEEAITSHMATESYRSGRKVYWDADKEKIAFN